MVKIGFDAKRIVRNGTGLGSYGRTLINSLSAVDNPDKPMELRLYAPDSGKPSLREQVELRGNVSFVYPQPSLLPQPKAWWRSRGIIKDLKRDGIALFHGLSGELPIGLKHAGIRSIVTIHDLIFLRHPEYYHWIDVQIYQRKFHQTLKEADRIIAISECTKRDILHYGNYPAEKISVVYQSCGTHYAQRVGESKLQEVHARYSLPARYILNVGTIEARKNVGLAIKALPGLSKEIHLVIVGRKTAYHQELEKLLSQDAGLRSRVHYLYNVPNDDLPAIYQMAEAFVYPSRYEGFGIPIIEAVQSGLPVVAASGSCLEEAGGPDCLYVDPDDDRGLAEAIRQSLVGAEGREERIRRSREYVRKFENQNVARQVMELYNTLLSE